jgi:lipoprotein-releasing system ATP-binding protein
MASPVLSAKNIAKSYCDATGRVGVLKGLDFEIYPGELALILGPSGSGKSTLLHILGLMDNPDEGSISIAGRNASGLSETALAKLRNETLGFVFQFDSMLPEFTVLENVVMPARLGSNNNAEPRALELLSGLGLGKLSQRLPVELSGGERQRAALARALLNRPKVILADEPTGNLDKVNGEMVFRDLRKLSAAEGVAVILVTHNEWARELADRIFHMKDGAVAEEKK